jgi:[acyl-carrier-protein] S-malonyltransferase
VSIMGLDEEIVRLLCEEAAQGELLEPVNFNCPGQIVLSGTVPACQRAVELAPQRGALKAVRLEVAGAFHTDMMASAAESLRQALSVCRIAEPGSIRALANIDAQYYPNAAAIVDGLAKQLTSPILWAKCMQRLLADGVEQFYEIGPNRVLTGLLKRIDRKAKIVNLNTADSIKTLIEGA